MKDWHWVLLGIFLMMQGFIMLYIMKWEEPAKIEYVHILPEKSNETCVVYKMDEVTVIVLNDSVKGK